MIYENSTTSLVEQRQSGRTRHFRRAIFKILKESATALTDREVMELLKESDVNNVRPEITRMKADRLVKETGKTRCSFTGKKVRQSTVTGVEYFDRGQAPKPQFNQQGQGEMPTI